MLEEENLLSIQQYALKHKMSTFAVLKLVNAKKLKTVKKSHDGEEQEYIIDDTLPRRKETNDAIATVELEQNTKIDYEAEFHKLLAKYIEVQEKYTKLIEENKKA
ncbi:MAG: hypothetical protein ACMV0K_12150 [Sulfurospirillum sp.]|jgi:hypothetical protein